MRNNSLGVRVRVREKSVSDLGTTAIASASRMSSPFSSAGTKYFVLVGIFISELCELRASYALLKGVCHGLCVIASTPCAQVCHFVWFSNFLGTIPVVLNLRQRFLQVKFI